MTEDLVRLMEDTGPNKSLWLNGLISGVCSLGNCSQLVSLVCIYGIFRFCTSRQSFTRISEEARVCLDQYSSKISVRFIMALVNWCNSFCSYLAQAVVLHTVPKIKRALYFYHHLSITINTVGIQLQGRVELVKLS